MSVYVQLPQVPLTLTFEEPLDDVIAHLQEMVGSAVVRSYAAAEGQAVVVNYAVIAAMTVNEGRRRLDLPEVTGALKATTTSPGSGEG